MNKTKSQKAIGYLTVTLMLTLVAGLFIGTALSIPPNEWTILFAVGFIYIMVRVMFLILEIDLFYKRNFDYEPVVNVEKEFKSKLKRVFTLKSD